MVAAHLKKSKISIFTLCFVIFSYTATASYGIEDIVGWGGPALAFLILILVPIIWSMPMALVSAELTSMYPQDGGLYVWINKGMGEVAGFLAGWWYFLCSVVSCAVFLVIAISYIESMAGGFTPVVRILVSSAIVLAIAYINVKGIGAVGVSTIIFLVIALVPFFVMAVMGLGQLQFNPFENFSLRGENAITLSEFTSYGLILGMWMYCGYEAIGSLAEEIDGSYHLIPKGLFIVLPITAVIYLVPTLIAASAVGEWGSWGAEAGEGVITYVEMGYRIGGPILMGAFLVSALFSNLTCYNAYIASTSRFPFVMARDNLFFKSFANVSRKYGTPVWAIMVTSIINIFLSTHSFAGLLVMAMTLYFIPVVMFLISAYILRKKQPEAVRPYKVPGGDTFLLFLICFPIAMICVAFWNMTNYELISGVIGLATGPVAYICFKWKYGGQTSVVGDEPALEAGGGTEEM